MIRDIKYRGIAKALCVLLCLGAASCKHSILQTVETGEIFLPEQDPKYKFVRNQDSSVDTQEAELTLGILQELRERYINEAYIRNQTQLEEAMRLLIEGQYGYAPLKRIARSSAHQPSSAEVLADLRSLIEATAKVSGMGASNPNEHRRREAMPGRSGYIATSASSKLTFVDDRGLVLSEVLSGYLLGALSLDQALGVHLDESIVKSQRLEEAHENQILIDGTNYTELEHHWDLAYGYYRSGLRQLAASNGIITLRGSARRLDLAFTLGRIDIGYHLYDKLEEHTQAIRRELSRILLIRIENLLIGGNTLANLREDPQLAFPMLSEAYGLIYALQFLRTPDGAAYWTISEVKALQAQLLGKGGLWETERLLGKTLHNGDLSKVVQAIKTRIPNRN